MFRMFALTIIFTIQKTPHKKKPTESTKTDEIIDEDEEPPIPVTERLMLPSSVFASEFEEDVGLLNKAAPQGQFFV